MFSFLTTDFTDGLLVIGTITAATTIVCPLLVWALTAPVSKTRTAEM